VLRADAHAARFTFGEPPAFSQRASSVSWGSLSFVEDSPAYAGGSLEARQIRYTFRRRESTRRVDVERIELQPFALARVLHAGLAQVVEDHVPKLSGPMIFIRSPPLPTSASCFFSSALIVRCGLRLSTENGPQTRTRLVVS